VNRLQIGNLIIALGQTLTMTFDHSKNVCIYFRRVDPTLSHESEWFKHQLQVEFSSTGQIFDIDTTKYIYAPFMVEEGVVTSLFMPYRTVAEFLEN
jgi:hypothetical protein